MTDNSNLLIARAVDMILNGDPRDPTKPREGPQRLFAVLVFGEVNEMGHNADGQMMSLADIRVISNVPTKQAMVDVFRQLAERLEDDDPAGLRPPAGHA